MTKNWIQNKAFFEGKRKTKTALERQYKRRQGSNETWIERYMTKQDLTLWTNHLFAPIATKRLAPETHAEDDDADDSAND